MRHLDELIDQTNLQGVVGIEQSAARKGEFGIASSDRIDVQLRQPRRANDAKPGLVETDVVGAICRCGRRLRWRCEHAVITEHGEDAATSDGMASDGGDRGQPGAVQVDVELLEGMPVQRQAIFIGLVKFFQIQASREDVGDRGMQHEAMDRIIRLGCFDRLRQGLQPVLVA